VERTTSPGALNLVSLADHLSRPDTPIPWIIDGLLVERERCIVFGEAGSQKSWLLIDMAISIAAGEAWLGHFKIPKARRVLYVDEEQSERLLNKRLKQLAHGRTQPLPPSPPLHTLSHGGVRFTKDGAAVLLGKLSQAGFDPDIIIVEALARVLEGNENEVEDVSAFWRHLEPLRQAGKTLIISHHMRKPNPMGSNAPRDRMRGSTDLLAGTDSAFAVETTREDGRVRSVTVACSKFREAEAPPTFEAELVDLANPPGTARWQLKGQFRAGGAQIGRQGKAAPVQPKSKTQQVEALILTELLTSGTPHPTADLKTKVGALGISESTFEEALRILKVRKEVDSPSRGKLILTLIGRSAAQSLVPPLPLPSPADMGELDPPGQSADTADDGLVRDLMGDTGEAEVA
jgi:hypothetical protein